MAPALITVIGASDSALEVEAIKNVRSQGLRRDAVTVDLPHIVVLNQVFFALFDGAVVF